MAEEQLRQERERKLAALLAAGGEAYPVAVARTASVGEFLERFAALEESAATKSLAGRVMSFRVHGSIMFVDLFDGSGRVQVVLRRDDLGDTAFDLFMNTVDQGDFISATGTAFTTKRGERSLLTREWAMAAKSLAPLPSEWYGLQDEDARYRERYLDILLNEETREMFRRRSKFWLVVREFLIERGFMEVETPVLETEPGGADARPFVTHHNALDIDVYLRISAGELWQKRLLVAGFEKIFEIGRIFRNEGMSHEHAQDYTQLEFYQAFSDYEKGMVMVRDLYRTIAQRLYGRETFERHGKMVDLSGEWPRIDFCEHVQEKFGVDPLTCTDEEAIAAARAHGITDATNAARAVDSLWKIARREIAGPAFLVGIPVYLEPLAKRSVAKSGTVERFQVLLGGSEIGKGFSELNDPADQRERFMEQERLREAGDDEAQRLDESYVKAMEYGMPPAFGFGVSERLFSFFENKSIRETQIFPLMRPKV